MDIKLIKQNDGNGGEEHCLLIGDMRITVLPQEGGVCFLSKRGTMDVTPFNRPFGGGDSGYEGVYMVPIGQ